MSALQHEGLTDEIRRLVASATNRLAAFQFPLCALLLVAGHDLIVLFYTKAYEGSARIFSVTILLLALSAFLFDPINRAFKELRKYVLAVNVGIMIGLFALLAPAIHYFGMMGAAILAVGAQFVQKFALGWMVSRKLEARAKDLRLFTDLFKTTGLCVLAGLCAYAVRSMVPSNLLIARILAVGLTVSVIYLPALLLLHLPGWELLTRERLSGQLRGVLAWVKSLVAEARPS